MLEPGGEFITYITDLGMRVLRFDVGNNRQLPDLVTYPGGAEYRQKWTTGVMSKVDLETGAIVGQIDTGLAKPQRSLAGVAEFQPNTP